MPVYVYKCQMCGENKDIIKPMSQVERPEQCPMCAAFMNRLIVPPKVHIFKPYFDWQLIDDEHPDGHYITSEKQKRKIMKKCRREYAGHEPGTQGCWV